MVLCPRCNERTGWSGDFTCDEVHECECGDGIVSYYYCNDCSVKIELTTDCKGEKEEEE